MGYVYEISDGMVRESLIEKVYLKQGGSEGACK